METGFLNAGQHGELAQLGEGRFVEREIIVLIGLVVVVFEGSETEQIKCVEKARTRSIFWSQERSTPALEFVKSGKDLWVRKDFEGQGSYRRDIHSVRIRRRYVQNIEKGLQGGTRVQEARAGFGLAVVGCGHFCVFVVCLLD